ncbi:MAG: TPM domain-containing protein [Bacteroidia bacterium]
MMQFFKHKPGLVFLAISALFLFGSPLSAQHKVASGKDAKISKFPEAQGWVNDFEEVLDSLTEAKLTKLITDHNKKTTNQISIVTISSITPYQFLSDYTKDLSNAWGVGEKGKNNGVTIIYSKALHEVRIATGLGLQGKLTDTHCQKIVDDFMLPSFKTGNYGKGMTDGVTEIIRILEAK